MQGIANMELDRGQKEYDSNVKNIEGIIQKINKNLIE